VYIVLYCADSYKLTSITSKKNMRSEIWSLMSYLGAPSWFITFAPADISHPICIYFADTQESIYPAIKGYEDRLRIVGHNPVAGARFFKLMVDSFIKHVLGVGMDRPGFYGKTSGYYGTVEQQSRLTLHMHMVIWIKNALTPQEIRDKILDPDSDFQTRMVEYLEGVHMGEFIDTNMEAMNEQFKKAAEDPNHLLKHPILTLPNPIPQRCDTKCGLPSCELCIGETSW
jgi:hypothetical protein